MIPGSIKPALILMLTLCATMLRAASPDPDGWQPTGNARFTDGWMAPHFGITATDERTWEVPIEKSSTEETYRIVDPYHQPGFTGKFSAAPNTTTPAYITIDCSDPDYVKVNWQQIFTFAEGIFTANAEQPVWGATRATYLEYFGHRPDAVTAIGANSTFNGSTITLRHCLVGFTNDPASAQTWNAGAFDTVITLPSASLTATGTDTAHNRHIEYYNLQGIRIPSPVPGHPYIMRQGTTATLRIAR